MDKGLGVYSERKQSLCSYVTYMTVHFRSNFVFYLYIILLYFLNNTIVARSC